MLLLPVTVTHHGHRIIWTSTVELASDVASLASSTVKKIWINGTHRINCHWQWTSTELHGVVVSGLLRMERIYEWLRQGALPQPFIVLPESSSWGLYMAV